MALTQLLDFLKAAVKYAQVDPEELENEAVSSQDVAYHKRLVRLAGSFGVTGLLVGIFAWVPELQREVRGDMSGSRFMAYLIAPIMGLIGGILFGVSMACLFAPARFFESSLGERLMRLVGTKSVVLARIVSMIVGLLMGGLLGGVLIKSLL
jgi:hypothetical protein